MEVKKNRAFTSLIPALMLAGVIWFVFLIDFAVPISLKQFAVIPQDYNHLYGIFTMHFLHGDWAHIANNTMAVIPLTWGIFYFYPKRALAFLGWSMFLTGLWVWLFARPNLHLGISGLIYAESSFIFFSGVFRRNIRAAALSLIIVFYYGSQLVGIFPHDPSISWEGHLFGLISGLVLAFQFRNDQGHNPWERKKYSWELEEDDDDDEMPEWTKPPIRPNPPVNVRYHYRPKEPPRNLRE